MKIGFNAEAGRDTQALIQFDFSGEVQGSCYCTIKNGELETETGVAANPDLTIASPFEVWMDVMTGKADGAQMFVEQKYQVSGDAGLLMKMSSFLGG